MYCTKYFFKENYSRVQDCTLKGIVIVSARECAWQCELLYVVINCKCCRFAEFVTVIPVAI